MPRLIVLLFAIMATSVLADLTCLNRVGQPTPWFMGIRYPGNVTNGSARYSYLDDESTLGFQTVLGLSIDDPHEPLASTIDSINSLSKDRQNTLVFSNLLPNGTILPNGAHAKAIVAFDNQTQTGVYILHTFLEYPYVSPDGQINYTVPLNDSAYASNNDIYGDYAYCMAIDPEILAIILDNLPVEQPNVYYSSGLFTGLSRNSTKNTSIHQFTLSNGDTNWFLTKSPNYNVSIYEAVVAPYFNVALAVQSWGHPYQDDSCYPNRVVVNVNEIQVNSVDKWGIWADNSKWAITILGTKPNLACLCDVDRNDDQNSRGGSCICSANALLFKSLTTIVTAYNHCTHPSIVEIEG